MECNLFSVILRADRTSHVAANNVICRIVVFIFMLFLYISRKTNELELSWKSDLVEKRHNTCTRSKQPVEENGRIIWYKEVEIDDNPYHSLCLKLIGYDGNIRYDNAHHFSFFDSDFGRQGFDRRRCLNILVVYWSFSLFGLQSKQSEFSSLKRFHFASRERFGKPLSTAVTIQSMLFSGDSTSVLRYVLNYLTSLCQCLQPILNDRSFDLQPNNQLL